MSVFTLNEGYAPGALGRVVELHGAYYGAHWGFGADFEAQVAAGLAAFLSEFDRTRDGFWRLEAEGATEGAVAIDGTAAAEGAHLRWFIVAEPLRGRGAGRLLLDRAVSFCRGRGYPRIYLWTFAGLDAARHLYEGAGFRLAREEEGTRWGTRVLEQRFELDLPGESR